jgi:hypothetical protein
MFRVSHASQLAESGDHKQRILRFRHSRQLRVPLRSGFEE